MKGKPKKSWLKIGCSFLLLILFVFVVYSFINPWWMLMNGAEKWVLGPATLTDQRTPKWSADSQYIAFLCAYSYMTDAMDPNIWDNPHWHHEESDVCVYDFKNKALERITFTRHKSNVAWSIDGTLLSWFTNDNIPTIYDFETHKVLQETYYIDYTENEALCNEFIWSDAEHPCWVFKGMEQEKFFGDFAGPKTTSFEWSLDEKYIAYSKEVYLGDGGNNYDALMVKDTKGVVLFEGDPNLFGFLYDWSPTDSILAWRKACCRADSSDKPVVALTHFPTGTTVYISIDLDFYWGGEWFSGGYLLEIGSGDWDGWIKIVSLECTDSPFSCRVKKERAYQLAHPEQFVEETISLSPDGKYLAYSSQDETHRYQIWVLNLESGGEQPMLKDR